MTRQYSRSESKACERCGRIRRVQAQRQSNVCKDCRDADPDYLRLTRGAA